jgi:predicted methyltransferase
VGPSSASDRITANVAGDLPRVSRATRDAESTMLANKDDPHAIKVFDPSIKGETDRFAYRFVKP